MRLLYSNMLPLKLGDGQTAFIDYFMDAVREADEIDIAVGYVSKAALKELQGLVDTAGIKRICLTMGMYYHEGMPEGTYNVAAALNEDWTGRRIGEVRLVRAFKYHGKAYVFYKDGKPFSAVVGSHNLGAIKLEASNLRPYELSGVPEDAEELQEISA
ncbi:MAG: NgoFVII family restriction endonuclease, partial [Lachnospiraceae bacterium]